MVTCIMWMQHDVHYVNSVRLVRWATGSDILHLLSARCLQVVQLAVHSPLLCSELHE